jgi:hypothetical protein
MSKRVCEDQHQPRRPPHHDLSIFLQCFLVDGVLETCLHYLAGSDLENLCHELQSHPATAKAHFSKENAPMWVRLFHLRFPGHRQVLELLDANASSVVPPDCSFRHMNRRYSLFLDHVQLVHSRIELYPMESVRALMFPTTSTFLDPPIISAAHAVHRMSQGQVLANLLTAEVAVDNDMVIAGATSVRHVVTTPAPAWPWMTLIHCAGPDSHHTLRHKLEFFTRAYQHGFAQAQSLPLTPAAASSSSSSSSSSFAGKCNTLLVIPMGIGLANCPLWEGAMIAMETLWATTEHVYDEQKTMTTTNLIERCLPPFDEVSRYDYSIP